MTPMLIRKPFWNNLKRRYLSAQRRKGDKTNLTRFEQDVVINFNVDKEMATLCSANLPWIRKGDAPVR